MSARPTAVVSCHGLLTYLHVSPPSQHYYTGGPVAYRLEWRGLSAVFGGDGAATPSLEALCAGADVAVIDAMATSLDDDRVPTMRGGGERGASGGGGGSRGGGGGGGGGGGAAQRAMSEVERRNIAMSHATPFEAGEMLAAAAPRLGERSGAGRARACAGERGSAGRRRPRLRPARGCAACAATGCRKSPRLADQSIRRPPSATCSHVHLPISYLSTYCV